MLLERLLGCALATLCMQDPDRDSKKRGFNGAAGNDDRTTRMRLRQGYHIEDSYDGADMLISTRIGVWCPRVHLEIDPGTLLPCADPPNVNSPVAMQQVENDRKSAAEYLAKAPSMHRKVLRALLQLLEPTLVVHFTEELNDCGPNDPMRAQLEQVCWSRSSVTLFASSIYFVGLQCAVSLCLSIMFLSLRVDNEL